MTATKTVVGPVTTATAIDVSYQISAPLVGPHVLYVTNSGNTTVTSGSPTYATGRGLSKRLSRRTHLIDLRVQ